MWLNCPLGRLPGYSICPLGQLPDCSAAIHAVSCRRAWPSYLSRHTVSKKACVMGATLGVATVSYLPAYYYKNAHSMSSNRDALVLEGKRQATKWKQLQFYPFFSFSQNWQMYHHVFAQRARQSGAANVFGCKNVAHVTRVFWKGAHVFNP